MTHIQWRDSYNFHIDSIDEQHREIVRQINALDDAVAGRDREAVGRVLNALVSCVITHFEFEEELMAASGHGFLKAHKRLHDRFIERLLDYSHRFDRGECIIEEFHPFLLDWFARHIEEDKDYGISAAAEMNAPAAPKKGWLSRAFGKRGDSNS